jgi:hypothetical protein
MPDFENILEAAAEGRRNYFYDLASAVLPDRFKTPGGMPALRVYPRNSRHATAFSDIHACDSTCLYTNSVA